MNKNEKPENSRRKFLKSFGVGVGAASLAGAGMLAGNTAIASPGKKVRVLTTDGTLVEVDQEALSTVKPDTEKLREIAREGLPNRKFVMVIDLAKCANARKCVDACQEGHMLAKDHEWIKLYSIQDSEHTSPYWLPRPCFPLRQSSLR